MRETAGANEGVEEVPKQIAWEEEAAEEEHVPNAVKADGKGRLDAVARKRAVDEMRTGGSEEDVEEYRRKRIDAGDPMAKFLGKDELVH